VFGLDYLVMSVAPDLAWLFVARVVAGMVGATHATANAYVADISPPEERAQNFGKLGAAWGLGFILGPVVGGLLGGFGSRVPFLVAAALALANVVYGTFALPESLPPERRRPFRITRANPLGALRQMRAYPFVVGVLATVVLYQIAHDANPSTWTYYTMLKFGWSEREVGYSMGAVGILLTVVQAGGIRIAIDRLGQRATVHAGLLVMAVGYAGFSLSDASWMMYLFMIPFALGGVAMPALRGLMANEVPEDSQGALQGAITSIASLTAIGAPVFMTQLFGAFAGDGATGAASAGGGLYFPGAPFLAAAILVALGAVWFARTLRVAPPGIASRMG
jgi:DHA1 family tetracycline resistance protein-like MFS transporter